MLIVAHTLDNLFDSCRVILMAVDVVGGEGACKVHLFVSFDDLIMKAWVVRSQDFEEKVGDGGVFV